MILYDASAFIELVKNNAVDPDGFITELTIYELGNVFWKMSSRAGTEPSPNATALIMEWQNVLGLEKKDFQSVLALANRLRLTFYDASYVFLAKKHRLELLTSDKELFSKSKNKIKARYVEPRE